MSSEKIFEQIDGGGAVMGSRALLAALTSAGATP